MDREFDDQSVPRATCGMELRPRDSALDGLGRAIKHGDSFDLFFEMEDGRSVHVYARQSYREGEDGDVEYRAFQSQDFRPEVFMALFGSSPFAKSSVFRLRKRDDVTFNQPDGYYTREGFKLGRHSGAAIKVGTCFGFHLPTPGQPTRRQDWLVLVRARCDALVIGPTRVLPRPLSPRSSIGKSTV